MILHAITNTITGPFVVVITDTKLCNPDCPVIICPDGGFQAKQDAIDWCHSWAGHEDTTDFRAEVRPLRSPHYFKAWVSM